ncbi:hypothetical protein ALQ72_00213 [Pseudomonas syringae pv. maculicola]|uniref:Uncharacterized protein n=1 Tax=Pseudomonas savastanoi pv. glycinea TaxID=318 RepID=A0A3M3FV75_PSESG|nr:hypothetical protein [Pseudomonas savastanoi pv. phaseolicola]RMM65823.1 hypothetical protein ALQ73_200036 [Pseudomonas savastanoi pv. glycinea]RMM74281.1 hypothetical protein ALQ72_00213 [Pseudomonas syringae pv. maculicola]RMR97449.1 hypothetical protein ALP76_200013 [Pseudomonas savastanoi pv. glycinea]RMV73547.1 hypothetical protein ALP06_00597 [Pseudomonas coronafaciens pv. atropurpurea]
MELKTNVDNSRRLDHLHMTQLSVSLNRLIPDSLTKPRCNDLQSKWPRPAIIAFFDRD